MDIFSSFPHFGTRNNTIILPSFFSYNIFLLFFAHFLLFSLQIRNSKKNSHIVLALLIVFLKKKNSFNKFSVGYKPQKKKKVLLTRLDNFRILDPPLTAPASSSILYEDIIIWSLRFPLGHLVHGIKSLRKESPPNIHFPFSKRKIQRFHFLSFTFLKPN